jgi:hypothetical protein
MGSLSPWHGSPHVSDGGDSLQMCRIAANILNKQSQTASRRWCSSLGVGQKITIPNCKKPASHEMLNMASDLDRFFEMA